MLNAIRPSVGIVGLAVGLFGCAQDVDFDAKNLGVRTELKVPSVTVPDSRPAPEILLNESPVLTPLPQCLGQLSHPTYRRDLPPQLENSETEESAAAGCDVENGVLYRFSSPGENNTRFGPTPDLHGIGI